MSILSGRKIKIALFISGEGSNAKNIYQYFLSHPFIHVDLLISSNPASNFYQYCIQHNLLDTYLIKKTKELSFPNFEDLLIERGIEWIVLAGFLKKIPESLIKRFANKIINIHPSLLPKYGGKGMYGNYVHKAVLENKDLESGITIHLVNEEYDKGRILTQEKINIEGIEKLEELRNKIHELEHKSYPRVIEQTILETLG